MENIATKKLIFFLVIVSISSTQGRLPKSIIVCSRNDPKLNQCIVDSVAKVQPYLASGRLDDDFQVTALEPFLYEGFTINPAPNFNVKVSNVSVLGSSNFTIEKLKFNIDTLVTDMIFVFPKITMRGKYTMKAKVAILDIAGSGDLESVGLNTRMRMQMFAKKYERDGAQYVKYEKVNAKIKPGASTIKLSNLFNGDPVLQNVGNQLINENQDLFLEFIIPIMEKQFAKVFKDVSNTIIENATFDELFPDTPTS